MYKMNLVPLIVGITVSVALFVVALYLLWKVVRDLKLARQATAASETDDERQAQAQHRGQPRTSKCLALLNGAIRRTDGSYVRAFMSELQPTMLARDEVVVERYRRLAGLLAAEKPEGTIIQSRYSVYPDYGEALMKHRQTTPPADAVHPPAVELHETSLRNYEELAARGHFKGVQQTVWVRVPTRHSNDHMNNGLAAFFTHFREALRVGGWRNLLSAFRESYEITNDGILRRMLADEEEAYREAERTFRLIEREGSPLKLRRFSSDELWTGLYLGHNESATSCPTVPSSPLIDLRPYLTNETIKGDAWYLLHGDTPVAMVTLFVPPEPDTHAGIMRNLIGHPGINCRYTIITEYHQIGKEKAKGRLNRRRKRIIKSNVSARTGQVKLNEDQERAVRDINQVKHDLASPSKMMTRVKVMVLVYGDRARTKSEERESVRRLEENCEVIIQTLREMEGADAAREEPVALRALYHDLLVGEMSPAPTEREIEEVATSLVTLLPTERAWAGSTTGAHTFAESCNGTIVPINLFQAEKFPPLGYALGQMGSGKTVFLGRIANDVLARVPHARVAGCDFNDGLGALVEFNEGRNLRFNVDEERTINVWDYPGLEDGRMPDEEQYAVVVAELMRLARRDDRDVIAETVLDTCVRAVYENEVAYNEPGGEKHEPTHTHLLNKLSTYHFESRELQEMAELLKLILERYRGNKFLDQPTHPDFSKPSRVDIYNIDSLARFPPDIQSALSFRIGARLISSIGQKVDGQIMPLLLLFTEMHEIRKKYPSIFLALNKGARMGRTNNVVTLFDTHTYKDLEPIHDITANAGIKIIGKMTEAGINDLQANLRLSEAALGAIRSISNAAGSHSQFVIALGSGDDEQVEKIQVELSPQELWVLSTHAHERNARARLGQLKPHWSMGEKAGFLASVYPRGLAFLGRTEIDESLLPSYEEEVVAIEEHDRIAELRLEVERLSRMNALYENEFGQLPAMQPLVERRRDVRGQDSQAIN